MGKSIKEQEKSPIIIVVMGDNNTLIIKDLKQKEEGLITKLWGAFSKLKKLLLTFLMLVGYFSSG